MSETKEVFKIFVDESLDQLEKVEENLHRLECEYDEETASETFRMVHSIKGSSLSLGFENLSNFIHYVENLLQHIKSNKVDINDNIIDLLFNCLYKIKDFFEAILQQNDDDNVNADELVNKIICITGVEPKQQKRKKVEDKFNITEHELLVMDDAVKRGQNVFVIKVEFEQDADMKPMKGFLIINNFDNIGEVLRTWPEDYEMIGEQECGNEFKAILITSKTEEVIVKNIDVAGEIKNIVVDEFKGKDTKNNKIGIKVRKNLRENTLFRQEKRDNIRVKIEKLDELLKIVGELVVDNGKLLQSTENLKSKYKKDSDVKALGFTADNISQISTLLQDTIMDIRVYTMENIFDRLEKMINNLSKRNDKQIDFIAKGKTIELDRGILEEIVDPLVHLVRNSIDHGIEHESERIQKGKDPKGVISLKVKHHEDNVLIEIWDDGKGLDADKIKQQALDKNLISQEEIENMHEQDIYNLIFLSGFSTSSVVTDLSGRGVGMDVVKHNIEKLNGLIEVQNKKDKGCKFVIRLPYTLAAVQALLVKEKDINFAIPLTYIMQRIELSQKQINEDIKDIEGKRMYMGWEQSIPVIDVGEHFNMHNQSDNDSKQLIVVGFFEKRVGLLVEKTEYEKRMIIKDIDKYIGKDKLLGDIRGINGVSILGDGSFAYILDIPKILKNL